MLTGAWPRLAAAIVAVICASALVTATGSARAEAIVPVEGPWSGVTSVGLPVSFQVEGGNVVEAHFGFHWGYCGNFHSSDKNTDPIDPEGHWSFDAPEGQTIEGAFVAPDRVEGTVSAVSRMTPGCPATKANFVAVAGDVPPPTPLQYYVTTNATTGFQLRLPEYILLGRAFSFELLHLDWTDWGKSVAYGVGQGFVQRFKREYTSKARVKLSRPIPDGPNKRLYSFLQFSLKGRVPPGYPRKGWFKFDAGGVVASSSGRWPGGPGYTGGHRRGR